MTSRAWLLSILVLVAPPALFAAENVFEKGDRKAFAEMFAKWFEAKSKAESPEQLQSQVKAFDELNGKLKDLGKKRKLDPLASPGELRALMMTPFSPEKSPQKARWWDRDLEPDNKDKKAPKYLLWLPKNYSHDVATPAIVSLHPPMKKMDELKKWASEAYPPAISDSAMIIIPINVENPVDWTSIPGQARIVMSLNETAHHFHVDRLRVSLDAEGPTAPAALTFAVTYPSLLANVVLRRPDAVTAIDQFENLRDLKFEILAPADGDAAKASTKVAEDLKAAGVTATVESTTFTGLGAVAEPTSQALATFVTTAAKNPAPKKVRFVTKKPFGNAYWLEFDCDVPKNGTFWIDAEVFSERNEIKITSPPGLRRVTVFFNDDLLDMGKSVKVLHEIVKKDADGKEVREDAKVCFEGTKARKLENALQRWHDANLANYGEVYLNWVEIAL